MPTVTENFTGTNGDALNGRTSTTGGVTCVSNGATISSNHCQCTNGKYAVWDCGSDDHEIEVTVAAAGSNAALLFGLNGSGNGYGLYVISGYVHLIKVTAYAAAQDPLSEGSGTSTHDVALTFPITFKVQRNGSTLTVFKNGVQDMQRAGVSVTTGSIAGVGNLGGGGTPEFDDLTITPIVVASMVADRSNILTGSGTVTVTLTGTNTSWTGTPFSLTSAPTGWSIASQSVASGTSATVTLNKGSGTGAFTVGDGTVSATLTATNTATVASTGNSGTTATYDVKEVPASTNDLSVTGGTFTDNTGITVATMTVSDGAAVTVADGKTFNCDTGTAGNAVVQVGQTVGGSELAFGAGGLAVGGNNKTSARLTLRGAGSVVASGANGVVTVTDGLYDVQGSATFSELGDATHYGVVIARTSASAGTHAFSNTTFDGTGGLNTVNSLPAGMGVTLDACTFVNTAGATALRLIGSAPSGGVSRSVTNSSFDKAVMFTEGAFTLTGNVFDGEGGGASGSGSWAAGQFDGNLVRLVSVTGVNPSIVGISLRGPSDRNYFLGDSGTDNPHHVHPRNIGVVYTISDNIVEYTSTLLTDGGEAIYETTAGDLVIQRLLVLPSMGAGLSSSANSSGVINYGPDTGKSVQIRQCTLHSDHANGGIFMGDGCNLTDSITELKDNVFWVTQADAASRGNAVTAVIVALSTPDILRPSGAHHNLLINMGRATVYEGVYTTGTPGANDTVYNGPVSGILYAADRSIATFAVLMGSSASTYAGKVADARAYLFADPGLIDVLNTHVRGGVAIINPSYKGLASDGLDHGACRMPTPLEPATASGTTITIANWSHTLDTGVTPDAGDFTLKSGRTCTGVSVASGQVVLTVSATYTGSVVGDYVTHTPGTNKITGTDGSQAIKFGVMVNDTTGVVGYGNQAMSLMGVG